MASILTVMKVYQGSHLPHIRHRDPEDLDPDCDGVSCDCFERGTGCVLKALRRAAAAPPADLDEEDPIVIQGVKHLEPVPEAAMEPYLPLRNPDEIALRRQRMALTAVAVLVVAGTAVYFAISHMRLQARLNQMVMTASSTPTRIVSSKSMGSSSSGRQSEPPELRGAAADGFNQLLMAEGPDRSADLSEPQAPEMTVVEAEARGKALMDDLFAVGSIQRQASALAGGMAHSEAIRRFFEANGGPGKLEDVRLFQEAVKDIQTGAVWPLLYVATDKSEGRGVLTRMVPVPGGVWKLDFEMLRDSFDQRLLQMSRSTESSPVWTGLLARRTTGVNESADVRELYLVIDCVVDASGQDRQTVLVSKMSALGARLTADMEFGVGYSGHAKLLPGDVGGRRRIIMKEFQRERD